MKLSDETIDGLVLELKLANNPRLKARRLDYERRVSACRVEAAAMTRDEIVRRLREKTPGYIEELLMQEPIDLLTERYARTFYERTPTLERPRSQGG